MSGATDFARLVPGFDFLQSLMKGATSAMPGLPGVPGMGQWIAPTLDPQEIEKRISELKTVQFWLEQNARLLGATIQALEVQRMTLSTLQTMNLPLADLGEALKARPAAAATANEGAESPATAPPPRTAAARRAKAKSEATADATFEAKGAAKAAGAAGGKTPEQAAAPAIDPMQWWGALTQQFTELATHAIKDGAAAGTAAAGSLARQAVKKASARVAGAGGARKARG